MKQWLVNDLTYVKHDIILTYVKHDIMSNENYSPPDSSLESQMRRFWRHFNTRIDVSNLGNKTLDAFLCMSADVDLSHCTVHRHRLKKQTQTVQSIIEIYAIQCDRTLDDIYANNKI